MEVKSTILLNPFWQCSRRAEEPVSKFFKCFDPMKMKSSIFNHSTPSKELISKQLETAYAKVQIIALWTRVVFCFFIPMIWLKQKFCTLHPKHCFLQGQCKWTMPKRESQRFRDQISSSTPPGTILGLENIEEAGKTIKNDLFSNYKVVIK